MTITPKFLPCLLAMHRSCSGCIMRFDKNVRDHCAENFFLLIGPDSGGKSRFDIERHKSNSSSNSFALGFAASSRAVFFKRTMRKRRCGGRLFQESWPFRFERFSASPHAQSNREEDETCRAAAEFAKLNCYRRVANSSRRAHSGS